VLKYARAQPAAKPSQFPSKAASDPMGQGGSAQEVNHEEGDGWQEEHWKVDHRAVSSGQTETRSDDSINDTTQSLRYVNDYRKPSEMSPRGKLVHEMRSLLKNFEARIANPSDLDMVGDAYRSVLKWAKTHDLEFLDWTCRYPSNPVVLEVFDQLEHEAMYPTWRRQALDEAYMLLYEDIAKQGDRNAVEALPEPHIPQETGYRTLPSPLVRASVDLGRGKTPRAVVMAHEHDTSSCYCGSKRCDYEIRIGPSVYYDGSGKRTVCGREIVSTGMQERQCVLDPVSALIAAVVPQGCCGRVGSNWSSILGYGPGQGAPSTIPENAPVWPENDVYQQDPFRPDAWGDAHPSGRHPSGRSRKAPDPKDGSSLIGLSRAKRDEMLQPSEGKDWWA